MNNMKKTVRFLSAFILVLACIFIFSPVTASADDEEFVSVSAETLFGKDNTVTIYGKASRAWNLRGTSYIDFKIYKNGKVMKHKKVSYDYDTYDYGSWVSFKYKPTAYGKYKVEYSTWDSPSNKYTAAFTVKKPSEISKYKPSFYLEGYEENTVRLYGLQKGTITSIYRAGAKNGKYKLIGTTKKDEYMDDTAPCGKDYYYKITTTIKNGKKSLVSKKSDAAVCYRSKPPKPVITSITRKKSGEYGAKVVLQFKWKRNSKYLKDSTTFEIQVCRSKNFGINSKTGYLNYDVLEQDIPGDKYSYTTDYLDYITYLEEPGVYYFRVSAVRSLYRDYSNHITTEESKIYKFTVK